MLQSTRKKKRLSTTVAACMAAWMLFTSVGAGVASAEGYGGRPSTENSLGLQVKSSILIEAESGQVLYQVNADEALPPASITKLMTEYIVLREVANGHLSWDEIVSTPLEATQIPSDSSRIFLAQGDKHTVRDLYIAMAVGSANDATIALAAHVAGSEQGFVNKMNEVAAELNLKTALFTSSTGLLDTTLISARDLGQLAYITLKEYPELLEFSSIQRHKFRERDRDDMINFNWMLGSNVNESAFKKYAYEGVDGLKTGYTGSAGYNFAGTVERNGMRFISVVMDTHDKGARFQETAKLYNYGYSSFEKKAVISAKTTVEELPSVAVSKGVNKTVPLVTDRDISFVVRKGVTPDIKLVSQKLSSDEALAAPVVAGTVAGEVVYEYTDAETGLTSTLSAKLITVNDVDKAGWWKLFWRSIGDFFAGLFQSIMNLF